MRYSCARLMSQLASLTADLICKEASFFFNYFVFFFFGFHTLHPHSWFVTLKDVTLHIYIDFDLNQSNVP